MMLLTCPHCGPRDETEFTCGGESHISRPLIDCADQDWAEYLFYRLNPKGVTYERWSHVYGCSRWFNVARNSVTHEISAIYPIGKAKPSLKSPIELVEPILTVMPR